MNLFKNFPRLLWREPIPCSDNHEKDITTEGSLKSGTGSSSTSSLPARQGTAEYLRSQARPPFENGTSEITNALFLAFLQGEIPTDREQQDEIAQICIDQGFPSSLAWLFAKTGMSEFTHRFANHFDHIYTIASALEYSGLSLN
jgi:hypothetical protein